MLFRKELFFAGRCEVFHALLEGDRERALLAAALAGEFQETDGSVSIFGGDGERGVAIDGVADVPIVAAVVAEFGADGGADELARVGGVGGDGKGSPSRGVFAEPGARVSHRRDLGSGDKGGLLRIDAVFAETAPRAVEEEARGGFGGEPGRSAVGQQAWVVERDVEAIFDAGGIAVAADGGGDSLGRPEERL